MACASSLPYTKKDGRTKGEFFRLCVSPLYYEGAAAEAVRRFKFRGKSSYARQMGGMIGRCAAEQYGNRFDLITWVPLSARRLRERGYCQAKLLAREAAKSVAGDCLPLLRKKRHTPPQAGLKGAAARKANISGAFEIVNGERLPGRDILLVDDVITTGATLAECARMLLTAGANSVCCATLCKTKKRTPSRGGRGEGSQRREDRP